METTTKNFWSCSLVQKYIVNTSALSTRRLPLALQPVEFFGLPFRGKKNETHAGDIWDAQEDMACALVGAILAAIWMRVRALREIVD